MSINDCRKLFLHAVDNPMEFVTQYAGSPHKWEESDESFSDINDCSMKKAINNDKYYMNRKNKVDLTHKIPNKPKYSFSKELTKKPENVQNDTKLLKNHKSTNFNTVNKINDKVDEDSDLSLKYVTDVNTTTTNVTIASINDLPDIKTSKNVQKCKNNILNGFIERIANSPTQDRSPVSTSTLTHDNDIDPKKNTQNLIDIKDTNGILAELHISKPTYKHKSSKIHSAPFKQPHKHKSKPIIDKWNSDLITKKTILFLTFFTSFSYFSVRIFKYCFFCITEQFFGVIHDQYLA